MGTVTRWRRSLERLVRPVATFHHQSGYPRQPWRVEYWASDDRYRASLHLHWNWNGRAHWLCVFLPEWPNAPGERPGATTKKETNAN